MPKAKKKPKHTAAPKTRTHITVLVVNAATRVDLGGAKVVITSTTPAGEKSQDGTTENDPKKKKGFRTKKPVRPGDKVITVTIAGVTVHGM